MSTAPIAIIPQTTPFPYTNRRRPGQLPETLNAVAEFAAAGRPAACVDTLRFGLSRARAEAASPEAWKADIDRHVRAHPAVPVALENPFVAPCYNKPRGYAGDAVMLDFIYRHAANRALVNQATPRGRERMAITLTTPAPRAPRNRCRLLADEVDAVCLRNPRAEILSIACGHLREAEHSTALAARTFGRFVALDQDADSLALIQRDYGAALGIDTTPGSVKTVIAPGARATSANSTSSTLRASTTTSVTVWARVFSPACSPCSSPAARSGSRTSRPTSPTWASWKRSWTGWLSYRDAAGMRAMAADGLSDVAAQVASIRTF